MRAICYWMAVACTLGMVLGPCGASAGTEFLAYEGRDAIHEGQGGERKTVNGVDFWMRGKPPKRFKVLGSITDRRHESGIFGAIRMSELDADIAKTAKAAGGDAVMLEGQDTDVIGTSSFASTDVSGSTYGSSSGYPGGSSYSGGVQGNAFTVGSAHAIRKHDSRWIVVKYLADDDAAPQAPAVLPDAAAKP